MANSVMLSSCQVHCSGIYFVPQLLIHIFQLGFRGVMCHLEKPSAAEPAEAAHGARVPCTPLGDGGRVPGVSGVCQATSAAAVRDRTLVAGYMLAGAGMTCSLSNRSTAWLQDCVLGARTQVISKSCLFKLLVKASGEGCSMTSLLLVFRYCHSEFP